MGDEKEKKMVEGILTGDRETMAEFSSLYTGKIFSLAMGHLRNEDDAMDVVQDTLLQVIRKVDTFRGESAFSTWVYRIAINFCLMSLRKKKRFQHVSIDDYMPSFDSNGNHRWPVENWVKDTTSGRVETNELGDLLKSCISELPEKYKTVLILRDVEGLSLEETANVIQITIASVKTRLHRARLYLRERMAKYLLGERNVNMDSDEVKSYVLCSV